MDHHQLCCGGFHMIDVIILTSKMLTYYGDKEGVPEYINMLEDYQKKAHRVQLPVPDVSLVEITTKSMLQDQAFTTDMKEWEEKLPMNKMWSLWKSTFPEVN